MESLLALKAAVSQDPSGFELLDGSGQAAALDSATTLRLAGGRDFDLNDRTAFESSSSDLGFITLKTVVNCWVSRELTVPKYIESSDKLGIPNLKFLERNDLVEWLDGSSSESEFIKTQPSADQDVEMRDGDEPLAGLSAAASSATSGLGGAVGISGARGTLQNHTNMLHGSKNVDFSYVMKLSHQHLIPGVRKRDPKSAHSSGSSVNTSSGSAAAASDVGSSLPPLRPMKGKDPIIILSPSPSSFLNMANVQDFLENGVFNPVLKGSNSPNLLRISRKSNLIGPRVKFVVVDSVDRFKPEYWDRVVAVFVTGQSWQLRPYKWHDPNKLFQNVTGFSLVYKNDPVPETLRQWNVKIETVERTARFRDREVMERIWERIEKYMISRGWPVHGVV